MRKTICKATNCCRLVIPPNKYCPEHQSLERAEQERKKVFYAKGNHNAWPQMYNSPRWKALRQAKLREQPFCEICGAEATEVHHIHPHNGDVDVFYDYDNLMSICHSCHAKETQKESEQRKKLTEEERRRRRDIERRKLWY